ncbi:YvrJ family protein [Terrisporobacter sp.]
MADLQSIIANLGFPIAISLFLLVRIEGKLQALTDSISELSHNITNLTSK